MFSLVPIWKATYTFLDPNGSQQEGSLETSGFSRYNVLDGIVNRFADHGLEIIDITVRLRNIVYTWSKPEPSEEAVLSGQSQ